jgi:hypothetical protein
MSHSYGTSTYTADASLVPARVESPGDLRPLATAAFLEQEKSPHPLVYVSGATRSGWAVYTSKALLEAVDLPSLAFLGDAGQHQLETEDGSTCVTVLEPSRLSSVASDLRRLLELVKATPMLAMDADTDGSLFGVEDVAQALARDYVCSRPAYDYTNVRGDEGQGADYLFTWLRSILRVIEVALTRGHAVVHELRI